MAFSNALYYYYVGALKRTYNLGKHKFFGNLWGNSYTKFVILEIKSHFT